MESQISEIFMNKNTAKEIWDAVKKMFGQQQNYAHIYQLKQDIATTKQGSRSITELVGHLTKNWDELAGYLPPTTDTEIIQQRAQQERIYQLLASLDPSYE